MMLSELAPPAADSGHRFDAERRWAASLALRFAHRDGVTRLVQARHQGPLRVQRPFYPEGSHEAC
ncbi:urease accessory protein ureD, partial [Halomonas sp. SUBG004]